MQQELYPLCPHCGSPLGWPGVVLSRAERLVLTTVKNSNSKALGSKQLSHIVGLNSNSVRSIISHINLKMAPQGYKIMPRPYRIVDLRK